MSRSAWSEALIAGLRRWCVPRGPRLLAKLGVQVEVLRPQCPLLLASGATAGPFYHSHPHVPAEFDGLQFNMASQVRYNAKTIRKIGDSVASSELPFDFSGSTEFINKPLLLNWVSNNGAGFTENARVCEENLAQAFEEQGIQGAESIGLFETGDNVSDRRFLLETFSMFGLVGEPLGPVATTTRIDLHAEFDSVDESGSIYTVGEKQFFMPYVPGYLIAGPGDLAIFSISAASGREVPVPQGGSEQVSIAISKLCETISALGSSFDDLVLLWNRVANLDQNENAVLMTRSQLGLTRPLAESVLEIPTSGPNVPAQDGTPIVLEYIAVVQIPRTVSMCN